MTKQTICLVVVLVLAAGCASSPLPKGSLTDSSTALDANAGTSTITQVEFQEPISPEVVQPPSVSETLEDNLETELPQRLPPAGGLNLAALEQMALSNNPAIAQSSARVRALRGKWVQVGLAPNPTTGYVGSEIGNDGAAGQQGGFVGQDFITANKLQRNRAVVSAEISRAEQELVAVQRRVQTDVRQGYYEALLAQRRVELAAELVRLTTEAAEASKSLVEAEEIPLAGMLQTEVQQQNAQVLLRTTQNGLAQAWRRLSTVVGGLELPIQPLEGEVSQLPQLLDWEEQLARLQTESPEVAAAMAKVERTRRALNRACVEAVPDISTQLSVQYDDATSDTIAGIQVGIPLPLWNRNQGGIRQAQAEITEAVRNVDRVELNLNRRLADAFRQYTDAHVTASNYASDILPRAQRTFELVQRGYKQGEVGYLDVLAAQQTFSQTNLVYLDALGSLWQSYVQIEGLLLKDSLSPPAN